MQGFENTEIQMRIRCEWNGLLEIMYPNRFSFVQHPQPKLCRDLSGKLSCYAWVYSHRNTLCSRVDFSGPLDRFFLLGQNFLSSGLGSSLLCFLLLLLSFLLPAFLLSCFPPFFLSCFPAFLLSCFPAFLLFCFSAFLPFCFALLLRLFVSAFVFAFLCFAVLVLLAFRCRLVLHFVFTLACSDRVQFSPYQPAVVQRRSGSSMASFYKASAACLYSR